jgi:hypothetical protein
MAVEFRLLGSVEASVDGEPVPIGYAQLQCVLAVLLVEATPRCRSTRWSTVSGRRAGCRVGRSARCSTP